MTTAERLEQYYDFDQEVIDTVSSVAEEQMQATDHEAFIAKWVLGNNVDLKEVEKASILDIRPLEHDPKAALMIHLAMGQPLDPNNLYQIAAIASANPDTRIITAGNPSTSKFHASKFTRDQRKAIAGGNFFPLNEDLLRYAHDERIETVDLYGYSFGADKALNAMTAGTFGVERVVVLEPVTAMTRNVATLGIAFGSSGGALKDYVEQSGPAFRSARNESIGMVGFNTSLARLSNFAIARGLAKGNFEARAAVALEAHINAKLAVAWGTKSELANNEELETAVKYLRDTYINVSAIRLPGHKHAVANDVWLQAAVVAQGLKA